MRTALLMIVALSLALASDSRAQVRAPYGSGTGVNSLGIKTDRQPRQTRNYTIRQPGHFGYGYGYGFGYRSSFSSYGPIVTGHQRFGCPYCGLFGCGGGCFNGPVVFPPVVVEPGLLFGPRAAARFWNGNAAPQGVVPNVIINNVMPPGPAPPDEPLGPAPALEAVPNREARQKAWRFIEVGDRNYRQGHYRAALDDYRRAAKASSDLADAYFRTAFAMMALDRWTEATLTIERGLLRKPDWPRSGFVLEELFATDEAKREMFRKLQLAKQNAPNNSDVRFLLGVLQHFNGDNEAALAEFVRVIEIAGRAPYAEAFLPAAPAAAQLPAPGGE
jgi:hypothetical protein